MLNTESESRDTPRSLRHRLRLKQSDLAVASGVGLRTVTEIEAGRGVRVESIEKVARVLQVSSGALLDAMRREVALRTAGRLKRPRRKGAA